ncbi:cupin domain-containing protein [Leptobacterium flavescens]|uniref:Cupin domain-containing protein n=1 Tax=Leptobacterium flavescens TaxID=472055 RepID=A0A6P0UM96_9FLAO|nr:cupin domain-containing protein [Leptobacterium flavescens]NER14471.1 cupin domain-containing protein [Leptobacterium flavescens]
MKNYKETASMGWVSGKIKGFQGRDLIDMENGGLKMIKIDPFASYPVHQHPDKTEYIYVLQGNPEITVDGKVYHGKKDDFFISPNSVKHSIANPSEKECLLLVGAIK